MGEYSLPSTVAQWLRWSGECPLLCVETWMSLVERSDLIVSYLYKRKLTAEELAGKLALNFHPAPLPQYRGFAPYTFGILNGEREWGVSCHHMTEEIDAGPLVEVRRFAIDKPDEVTAEGLKAQTMPHLARLFRDVMERVARGEELPAPIPQGYVGTGARYYTKHDFEAARSCTRYFDQHELDIAARAFWCPPYAGLDWRGFTIAPKCVAGKP